MTTRQGIKIAVLGCGRIGRMHARLLARHSGARLTSVFDVVPEAVADAATELGVRAAVSIEDSLGESGVEAVLIATPTNTHVDLIIAAAQAGKAILCEKPIDLSLARALECAAVVKSCRAPVMIGFNRRFDPSFRAVRERVAAGEIGRIEQVIITSRDPSPPPASYVKVSGGLFRDMTIHDFDMARYLAGDIVSVYAAGANLIDPAIKVEGDIDTAMIVMRGASGALVHINNSRRCVYGYDQRIEVFGAEGMLQAGNQFPTSVRLFDARATAAGDPVQPFFIERYAAAYAAEIDHFLECVRSGATPLARFADGVEALRIAEAAERSLETGLPQALSE